MKPMMQVLMIGVETTPDATKYSPSGREYTFTAAKACAELVGVRESGRICAAVLNPALALDELARCAQVVRWRWPAARILVLRAEEPPLEDGLYDERLDPGLSPDLLIAAVDGSIDTQQPENERVRLWEC
jgi:hypothetical protein